MFPIEIAVGRDHQNFLQAREGQPLKPITADHLALSVATLISNFEESDPNIPGIFDNLLLYGFLAAVATIIFQLSDEKKIAIGALALMSICCTYPINSGLTPIPTGILAGLIAGHVFNSTIFNQ